VIKVEIKPTNQAQVKRKFERLISRVSNTGVLMKKISIFLDQWTQQNFDTEGGHVGGWKPLKAGGRKLKGKFDPMAKILRDTSELSKSFKPFSSKTNAGIGSDLPYAPTHEHGKGAVPQRRMLPKGPDVMDEVLKKAEAHVKKSISRL